MTQVRKALKKAMAKTWKHHVVTNMMLFKEACKFYDHAMRRRDYLAKGRHREAFSQAVTLFQQKGSRQ